MAGNGHTPQVAVVGAGVAGLVAALELAARGLDVQVFERAEGPGGKLRPTRIGDALIDAGPTVFTMRFVFEELWRDLGRSLESDLTLRPLDILARHAWSEAERLDLFADPARSEDAIGAFAGTAEARGYRAFRERARRTYEVLERSFIRAPRPSLTGVVAGAGLARLPDLLRMSPFASLWDALGDHFRDPRLRQLFGRYATYCGSSPFAAPATLMLVAHVEEQGVWAVEGGMHRLATVLERLGRERGARYHYGAEVASIAASGGRAAGIVLADGERIAADAVVFNGDEAALDHEPPGTSRHHALGARLAGEAASRAAPAGRAARSLSAVTWAILGEAEGFPLARHNVFFGRDYREEFDAIFRRGALPAEPTTYVCAQDRADGEAPAGPERFLCLVNAPAVGDTLDAAEIERCAERTFAHLGRCGLTIRARPEMALTSPADFAGRFPGTGGALYGRASHGWRASFERPPARTRLPGLYLAGGSVHPGPGVPMAALSGRIAAASLIADLASTAGSRRTATSGGTSTASPTTAGTASR